jgi:uncharacterized protein YyaL (SSP411 family)
VRYLEAAKKMTRGFTQHPSFRESSMFPDNIYPFIYKSSRVSSLTKSNTGMTNAILRLYEVSGDDEFREAAEKALGGILKFRTEEGAFFKSYDIGKGGPLDRTVEKGDNQSAMDVLINAYLTMKDKGLLKVAAECADFWCENQEDTGLFNERKKGQDGHGICTLDSQADMSVAVAKIRELTGKGRYKEAIRKSSSGFSMFVERKGALYEAVHPLTGKPVRKDNELKMLGGALKGMMAVHTSLKGKRLLSSRKTVLLTRDR